MAAVLPGSNSNDEVTKINITKQRMAAIEEATKKFMTTNYRRPCPANGTLTTANASFGTETTSPGVCTGANFGPHLSTYTGLSSSYVVGGMVPVRALGLPDEYALDGFGRRFTYLVDRQATSAYYCRGAQSVGTKGMIKIRNASTDTITKDFVMAALISYGKDGHGAFPAAPAATIALTDRINTYSSDANTLANAFVNSSFAYTNNTTFTGSIVKRDASSTFDDIVYYEEATKNKCCMGKRCYQGFRMDANASALDISAGISYVSGNFNGDAIKDLAIANYNGDGDVVTVLYGSIGSIYSTHPWPIPTTSYAVSADGSNGWSVNKDIDIDYFGYSLAAGDFTGDGIDDLFILGSGMGLVMYASPLDYYGDPSLRISTITDSLDYSTGVNIIHTGSGVPGSAAMADVDGDGYDDIIFNTQSVGDATGINNGPEVAIIWGRESGDVSKFLDPDAGSENGIYLYSATPYQFNALNHSIATGDVSGDGVQDIVFGAPTLSFPIGAILSVFGRARDDWGAPHEVDADAFSGTTGYVMVDDSGGTVLGSSVAVADINKDGYDDAMGVSSSFIIGLNGRSAAYAAYMTVTGYVTFYVNHATNRPAGAAALGTQPLSNTVSTGDVNGDGRPDILLSNPYAYMNNAANAGMTYVIFNPTTSMGYASTGFGAHTMFTAANSGYANFNGTKGFVIEGAASNYIGNSGVLDFNGDNKADVIVPAPGYNSGASGMYVVWGRNNADWSSRTTTASDTPSLFPKIDLTDWNQ